MTRISTLMMSSLLAVGTSAVAQDTATTTGANESGSSISNPAGIATIPGRNADGATPPLPAAPVERTERVEPAEPVEAAPVERAERVEPAEPVEAVPAPEPEPGPAIPEDRTPDVGASATTGADTSTTASAGLYGHANPGLGSPSFQRR